MSTILVGLSQRSTVKVFRFVYPERTSGALGKQFFNEIITPHTRSVLRKFVDGGMEVFVGPPGDNKVR